ncbi:MAG: DUF1273 domain-containing protein [Oscillospiraceae bacterium]|nr:DUF1273 domain-containing protein [Oscillospiraceae bacterium]
MQLINTTCSVVCIQAHRLDSKNTALHQEQMERLIERELRIAINDGVSLFRIGMNMGADVWAARLIIRLRDNLFPHVRLHCYLPCEAQANHWPELWREPYFDVLAQADEVRILQGRYTRGCLARRNREMFKGSGRLLAVHDNVADGGISRAVSYAESRGIEVTVIRPLEGPDAPARLCGYSKSRFQTLSTYSAVSSSGISASKRAR